MDDRIYVCQSGTEITTDMVGAIGCLINGRREFSDPWARAAGDLKVLGWDEADADEVVYAIMANVNDMRDVANVA